MLLPVNGVALDVDLSGPARAPLVVFANSLGATRAMWDAVTPLLRGRYRVLRFDARGHGGSLVTGPFRVEDLADDLAALIDHAGAERAHVVGLSLGGIAAQCLALRHPERVASLSLLATAAHFPSRDTWTERAALVRSQGTAAIADATMERWFTAPFRDAEPARAVRGAFLGIDRQGYAQACEALAEADVRAELPRITAPTLVVSGRDDPATPPARGEEIAAAIPNAEFAVLPNAAHLFAVERPDALGAYLLAFLERQREPAALHPPPPGTVEEGLANRRAVLGEAHVARSLAAAGAFARPWQDVIARVAWAEVWGDDRLPWKTRSMLVLAMTIALNREEEFKLHLRPALRNGVTRPELQALLLQAAVYAGVPAANSAFRWAREALGAALDLAEHDAPDGA